MVKAMKNNSPALSVAILISLMVFCSAGYADQNGSAKANKSTRPNIVLIYADDLGIGLLGHEGQKIIETPHIDKLASQGIRFQNAYSNMLCSVARASLLTGRHDSHARRFEITSGNIYKKISTGEYSHQEIEEKINAKLSPELENFDFLSAIAKESGYKTAQFGKLEWGFSTTHQQMQQHGWDHYLGYLDHVRAHGFYPPFLFSNGELVEIEGNTLINAAKSGEPETPEVYNERWNMTGKKVYSQRLFMDSIDEFIDANKNDPFFLYFPTQLPHGPVSIPAVHADFVNDKRLTQIEKEYASMVKLLDDNVGQIVKKLESLNILDNTIIIFTSDNGHEIYYSQAGRIDKPYTNISTGVEFDDLGSKYYSDLAGDVFDGNGGRAGLKRSNLEGGIAVPLIIQWPDKIKADSVSSRLTANYDLLPTVAEIVGYEGPLNTDGLSFYNQLMGKKSTVEHDHVVYSSFTGPSLITNDGWKLRTYLAKDSFELFYLPGDFKEEHDLAKKHPEKLKALKDALLAACDGNYVNGLYSSKNKIDIVTN